MSIPIQINQRSTHAHASLRSIPRSRIARAMVASLLIASGCATQPVAAVEANTPESVLGGLATIDQHDQLLAVAPLLAISVQQSPISQPREGVQITLGMARGVMTQASQWTASSHAGWYYYNTDPASLSTHTMHNHRVQGSLYDTGSEWRPGTIHLERSTVPAAPNEYAYDFGDHDSLGFDTYYIRVGDGHPPIDGYFVIKWDESHFGEDNHALSTVESWHDLSDPSTAAAVASWNARDRYVTDPRTGETIDLAGREPSSTAGGVGSPIRGAQRCTPLPAGTQRIIFRVTNSQGLMTQASVTITVDDSTRVVKTVSGKGGDYATLAEAISAANASADPFEIVIDGNHTETIDPGGLTLSADSTLIRWDTNGSRPQIQSAGWGLMIEGDGCTLDGIELRSTVADADSRAFVIRAKRCAMIDCAADGIDNSTYFGYAFTPDNSQVVFDAGKGADGCLIQSCRCSLAGRYIVGGLTGTGSQGFDNKNLPFLDLNVIGCVFVGTGSGPSIHESVIRDLGLYYSAVYVYNDLNEYTKDALRQMQTDHSLIYGNRLDNGPLRIGLSSGSEIHKAIHIRVDSNLFADDATSANSNSLLTVKPGCRYAAIVNNVIIHDKGGGVLEGASKPGIETDVYAGYCECRDIVMAHNTIELKAGYGSSGKPISGFGLSNSTYVSDTSFANTLIVKHAGHSGSVWKTGTTSFVDNDVLTGSLDARYEPDVSASTHATIAGVLYDFYGTRRDASSVNGAVTAAPLEAPPSYLMTIPTAGDSQVSTTLPNLTILFDEEMTIAGASGSMQIVESDGTVIGSVVGSWTHNDWLVNHADRRMVTLNVGLTLEPGTSYAFLADAGSLKTHSGGEDWPGINDPNELRWTAAGSADAAVVRVRGRGRARARSLVITRSSRKSSHRGTQRRS